MRLRVSSLALAATVLAVAPLAAQGATVKGVVVHHNRHAGSFTVAGATGRLSAVHAARAPRIGTHVTVKVRKLLNGTYAAQHVRAAGTRSRVRLRGTVTNVDAAHGTFVLSARGVSLVVRHRVGHHRDTAGGGSGGLPAVGDQVTVDATVDPSGNVDAQGVTSQGTDTGPIDLEGVVLSVDATTNTLTISGDDDGGSGSLTVLLPAGFDSSVYKPGDAVELLATLNPDGTYTAVGSSGDHGTQQANNATDDQGDNHSGDHHSSDPTVADATTTCQSQQADPNFATTHDGKTFDQYYTPEDTMSSFQKCVDENSHGQGGSGGGGGDQQQQQQSGDGGQTQQSGGGSQTSGGDG